MRNQNLPGLSPSLKLLIAIACSLSLIVSDSRSHWSTELRVYTDTIFSPLYLIANTPFELNSAFREQIRTRSQLVEDNRHLNETLMLLKSELLKYGQLKHENAKLRALLESPIQLDSRVEVAEIMNVATDPFQQQVVMNKGTENGVYIGQPIIGEDGIVGQVVTVSNKMSRALLITDRNHSIPVRVVRNDFRAIATGTGKIDELVLQDLPRNIDIKEGDLLVSSGLGGKFPAGYPVARVTEFIADNGVGFSEVKAKPLEKLSRLRYVLLMWPSEYFTPDGQNLGLASAKFLIDGMTDVQ